MSIRVKLILVLSAVLVLAFVSTSVITYVVSKDQYRSSVVDEILPLLTNNILSEIQQDLMTPLNISSLMAHDTFLKDWTVAGEGDVSQIEKYLREIKDTYGFFTAFYVSDRTGRYYYYNGVLKTISQDDSHDVWYYSFKEQNVDVDLDVDTDEASAGSLTIFINHRVLDYEGGFLGVAGVGLSMDGISRLLSEYEGRFGRLVYMVDSNGLVQAHPDIGLVESASIVDAEGISTIAPAILAQSGGSKTYEFNRRGRRVFLEVRYFPQFDWYLIGEQEASDTLGRIRSVLLTNLAVGLLATCIVIAAVVIVVNRFQGRLEALVMVDPLTGVANRRHFMETLRSEAERAKRYGHTLSLLMIDVDRFKKVNDRYGHLVGDRLLRMLTETIQDSLRDSDTLGRLGGEEFGVVLQETSLDDAVIVAERIRAGVSARFLQEPGFEPLHTTVSVGAASMVTGSSDYENLLRHADTAMYRAKADGRNRVGVHNQEDM